MREPFSDHAGRFRAAMGAVGRSPLFQFLAATLAAMVIFFARAPVAFMAPLLFAEDRAWTSQLVTRGFWETAFHAREDYCILGNVIVVWLGMRACEWLCEGDVFQLPRCLAVASYLFMGAAVSLPVLLLRRQLRPGYLLAAWLLACFLPLGIHSASWSGFEILGRAINLGYVFLFIAFILIWHRIANVTTASQAVPVDLGLLVCTATNPLCIAMLPATGLPYLRRLFDRRESSGTRGSAAAGKPWSVVLRDPVFVSLCLLMLACLFVNGLPKTRRMILESPPPPVGFDVAIEMGVARSLLYPLVWPIYHRLGTTSTLAIAALTAWCLWRFGHPRHRLVVAGGLATVGLMSIVLITCRPEVGMLLDGYRSTFPDRYFYGQNLVATLVAVVFAADVAERLREHRPRLAWLPAAALIGLAVAAAVREPAWRVADSQFLLAGDDCFESGARLALRGRQFVDAARNPDPRGAFVEVNVQAGCEKSLVLPREAVMRSLAMRQPLRDAATRTAATSSHVR
jgi:hypothetical protein